MPATSGLRAELVMRTFALDVASVELEAAGVTCAASMRHGECI